MKKTLSPLKSLTFSAFIFTTVLAPYSPAFAGGGDPTVINDAVLARDKEMLARLDKNIVWVDVPTLRVDLTGDGKREQIFLGKRDDKVFIGIIAGTASEASKPWKLEFSTDKLQENALCSAEVNITTEAPSLPLQAFGCNAESNNLRCSELRNLNRSFQQLAMRKASGIVLADGLCDPFHIYWDSKMKLFRWWRF